MADQELESFLNGDLFRRRLIDVPKSSGDELSHIDSLSRVTKGELIALVDQFGLPLEIRTRDASRDIIGKLLRFFGEHPLEKQKLRNKVSRVRGGVSPELVRAMSALLKDTAVKEWQPGRKPIEDESVGNDG